MSTGEDPGRTTRAKDAVDGRRMVKVVASLAMAMGAGVILCHLVMPADPPRADRTAFPPDMAPVRAWEAVVIHHTGTSGGTFESVSGGEDGSETGQGDLRGHFVVGNGQGMGDGEVRATSLWTAQQVWRHCPMGGEADGDLPPDAVGVVLVGDGRRGPPTEAQMESLVGLAYALTTRLRIPLTAVHGHGEVSPAACPGEAFPMAAFLRRLGEKHRR